MSGREEVRGEARISVERKRTKLREID